MRHKLLVGASAFALGVAIVSAAGAADLGQPAAAAPADPVTGFVDLHGGFVAEGVSDDNYSNYGATYENSDSYSKRGFTFGGDARGVINIAPSASVQADSWFDISRPAYDDGGYNSLYTVGGIAAHLSWHPSDRDIVGVLGSVGIVDGDIDGNIGLEAAHSGDNWRLYGQIGAVKFLASDGYSNNDYSFSDFYAALEGDYFVNPNLMLSANLGVSEGTSSEDSGYYGGTNHLLSWGAKAEFKPDNSPISFYVAYLGSRPTGTFTGDYGYGVENYSATNHKFLVGLRLPFGDGGGTVQSLQNNVGLSDLNPDYGPTALPW